MAKAQLENGYTRIANELLDKICGLKLSQNEFKVFFAILRLSFGWGQKDTGDRAGICEIQKLTNLASNRVYSAIKGLRAANVVEVMKQTRNTYKINTDTDFWQLVHKVDQSTKLTSAESGLVQKVDYPIVQKVDYGLVHKADYQIVHKVDYRHPSEQSTGAAPQLPKEIKEIKERKEREPANYQKALEALGLPATGILSPKDHQALNALLDAGCTFDDIKAARIRRKKNRLEWIQDSVCEERDARLSTTSKLDHNGIPILPNGYMDWDNMTFEQKSKAAELRYER